MLQQPSPDDFVIATGKQYSVRDFVERSGKHVGMEIEWQGSGVDEIGIDRRSGKTVVRVDPRYFRPTEVETLLGDASKARDKLGWTAQVSFDQLVAEMMDSDLMLARRDALVAQEGYRVNQNQE
jgi:GDPmannose 4,6-dehydratase